MLCMRSTILQFGVRKNYGVADSDDGLEIAKLGIDVEIIDSLVRKRIAELFPIQEAVLDPVSQCRDMIDRTRTETGKTLAFGIPIIWAINNKMLICHMVLMSNNVSSVVGCFMPVRNQQERMLFCVLSAIG
ncbi:hypothetical protein SUGI_0429570 [Cryptomeria japonica]|nr:hypothetical protein SUGI_0429570 [Cryptomeria japonica]